MLWLRHETKDFEARTPLTPEHARQLTAQNVQVVVEKSVNRIYQDEEYIEAGCELVNGGDWVKAPDNAYILGLKELPQDEFPLTHNHIYFAHAFKSQKGSDQLLKRFVQGQGCILDLEFLFDVHGKRIAAFGYWAGFIGAALTALLYAKTLAKTDASIDTITVFKDKQSLVDTVKNSLKPLMDVPRAIVLGAFGRCGTGACDLFDLLDVEVKRWDRKDTEGKSPILEILDYELFINCVLVSEKTPLFLSVNDLQNKRALRLIGDVSCDPTSPYNPLPFYDDITTCEKPIYWVPNLQQSLGVTAIDHLPSLLPRESSEDFSAQLLPYLKQLLSSDEWNDTWQGAKDIYNDKIKCIS